MGLGMLHVSTRTRTHESYHNNNKENPRDDDMLLGGGCAFLS